MCWRVLPQQFKKQQMNFLYKQIHFVASIRSNVIIGLVLGLYLSFIIIFLEPFDTSQFEADNRLVLLWGYGILTFLVFVIHCRVENFYYFRIGTVWTVVNEIISVMLFLLFSGTLLYLYNRHIVNNVGIDLSTYWRFLSIIVACMVPVFVPPMLYLRQKFGERIVPPEPNLIVLIGENKNEILSIAKSDLLFVKAVENYIEICFVADNTTVVSKTFRQTLSNVCSQLPFLEKCHRSYLVNINAITRIEGNSQSARIIFAVGPKEIPLSKTYYKALTNKLH